MIVIAGFAGECTGQKCPPYNGGKAHCYGYIGGARQAFGARIDYGKKKPLKKRYPAHIPDRQASGNTRWTVL